MLSTNGSATSFSPSTPDGTLAPAAPLGQSGQSAQPVAPAGALRSAVAWSGGASAYVGPRAIDARTGDLLVWRSGAYMPAADRDYYDGCKRGLPRVGEPGTPVELTAMAQDLAAIGGAM